MSDVPQLFGLSAARQRSQTAATRQRYRSHSMLYVIHVWHHSPTNSYGCASAEGLFRLQFAQGRVAQLDLAPTLAAFASRSVISTPPRFARDYSTHARLVISVETPRLRTSDAEHDQGVSRKPSLHAIRESRIASSARDKMVDSTASCTLALRAARPSHRVPAFRFLCSSSFRHSACRLRCPGRRFGTGRPCF